METPPTGGPGAIQDAQYRFPYHYLPRLEGGRFRFHEVLAWGHEYLSYMNHVVAILAEWPWSALLDVGCGDGRLVSLLTSRFPGRRIVGLDYSSRAISLAQAMVPIGEFVAGDVTRSELFQEQFDCATCIDTIEHVEPSALPDFIRGIRLHLERGARLIVTVPSTNVKLNEKHYQHFDTELLTKTLSGPFELERIGYLNGTSGLLRLVRALLTNRVYTVTHPVPLTAFYNYYVRNYLSSDSHRGGRLLAVCRAA